MPRSITLSATGSVVLDSHGNGTVGIGPTLPGTSWLPTVASVSASSNTNEAQCKVYAGAMVLQPYYVDGTLSGSTGDSTVNITGQIIYPGQYVFAVWTLGQSRLLIFPEQGTSHEWLH
jgi:hypothetical protein